MLVCTPTEALGSSSVGCTAGERRVKGDPKATEDAPEIESRPLVGVTACTGETVLMSEPPISTALCMCVSFTTGLDVGLGSAATMWKDDLSCCASVWSGTCRPAQ